MKQSINSGQDETSPCTEPPLRIVVFCVGDMRCGLDISTILEIKRIGDLTPVHRAAHYVRGVMNIRGTIVTLIDMRSCMAMAAHALDGDTRVVVVNHGGESVGLIVDKVEDALEVSACALHPTPPTCNPQTARFFAGIYKSNQQLIALVSVPSLLTATMTPDAIVPPATIAADE